MSSSEGQGPRLEGKEFIDQALIFLKITVNVLLPMCTGACYSIQSGFFHVPGKVDDDPRQFLPQILK